MPVPVQTITATTAVPKTADGSVVNVHFNVSAGAAATLGSLLAAGIPYWYEDLKTDIRRYPQGVRLQVVGANEVRVTYDGQAPVTGAAPIGDQIPQSPGVYIFRNQDILKNNALKITASAATVVAVTFVV